MGIIEVNDCALTLLGERQRDDMEIIAELVTKEMELKCKVPENKVTSVDPQDDTSEGVGRNICRTDSHESSVSSPSTVSELSITSSVIQKEEEEDNEDNIKNGHATEAEDTMKN